MKFTAASNIIVKEEVAFRSNKDGSIVVMKMNDDDMFYKISGVAAEMWQKFSEKKNNLGEVANDLSKDYLIPSEKIISDAQIFLDKILELELISLA